MTICIGALCDEGQGVVACADHMVTGGDVQFEQAGSKITKLTDRCIALTSGPALTHTDVFDRVRMAIRSQADPSIRQVVEEVKKAYSATRNERAEEKYLRPLGLSLQTYLQAGSDLVFQLGRQITEFRLGLSIVIAGVDHTRGHLYIVKDPGTAECFDGLGFVTIGSGSRHAEATFIAHSYSRGFTVVEAAFVAFEARRRAESAPGVGNRLTDLIYIGSEIREFNESALEGFQDACRKLRDNEDEARKAILTVVQSPADSPNAEGTKEEADAKQN